MKTQTKVHDFIRTLKPDAIIFGTDDNLQEKDILDSIAMMELVLWSEEEFGFTVDTDDLIPENFSTLRTISSFIDKNVGQG